MHFNARSLIIIFFFFFYFYRDIHIIPIPIIPYIYSPLSYVLITESAWIKWWRNHRNNEITNSTENYPLRFRYNVPLRAIITREHLTNRVFISINGYRPSSNSASIRTTPRCIPPYDAYIDYAVTFHAKNDEAQLEHKYVPPCVVCTSLSTMYDVGQFTRDCIKIDWFKIRKWRYKNVRRYIYKYDEICKLRFSNKIIRSV